MVDPATESDGLSLLPSGDRLVAVNLTVANAGTGIQQESIDDDVTLIDSGGHSYNWNGRHHLLGLAVPDLQRV